MNLLLKILGITSMAIGAVLLFKALRGGKLPADSNVLFVGDSYTYSPISYADQLKSMLPGINMTKIAKVGAKTDWMVKNALPEITTGNYSAAFILGGLNNIYALNNIESAKSDLQQLYDAARKSGMKVIAITIPPTDFYDLYDSNKGVLTTELNQWIKNNRSVDEILDLNNMLKGKDGRQNPLLFSSDELHITAATQGELAEKALKLFA